MNIRPQVTASPQREAPGVQTGRGTGGVRLLLLLSDNFVRPRTRRHWDGLAGMMAHGIHADPYIGLFVALLDDPRFTATAVDLATLYAAHGTRAIVSALAAATGEPPDYIIINVGNQPFCLTAEHLMALKAQWPSACLILITTDEAIDFRKVTWHYAPWSDLVLSLDGWAGWGERYRDRWCFMHLVSSDLYRADEAPPIGERALRVGMFGRPKSGRHELIARLRDSGIEVDTNIEGETDWQPLADTDYVERMRRTKFALVPLRMHRRGDFHLIGRLYEAVFAGAVPVVEECDLLAPYDPLCGPYLTYRTADDVLSVVGDPNRTAEWSAMAARTGLMDRVRAYGREAFFDLLAERVPASEIRRRLGAEALGEAVAKVLRHRPIRLGRLYRERVSWLWHALRRFRLRDAVLEIAALIALLRSYRSYR